MTKNYIFQTFIIKLPIMFASVKNKLLLIIMNTKIVFVITLLIIAFTCISKKCEINFSIAKKEIYYSLQLKYKGKFLFCSSIKKKEGLDFLLKYDDNFIEINDNKFFKLKINDFIYKNKDELSNESKHSTNKLSIINLFSIK